MINTWKDFFNKQSEEDYYYRLMSFLNDEYDIKTIYPPRDLLFNAFDLCPLNKVKVVIIGQDPYHEPKQANGLAFSIFKGTAIPPSLRNIYKEIENDFGKEFTIKDGDLTYLAKQGVLLLNSIFSVEKGKPLSHDIPEYRILYQKILEQLNAQEQPIVFMLWGGSAKKCIKYLTSPHHLVLTSNHPSPLSANRGGWFNNHLFSKANEYLKNNNVQPVEWIK